MIVTKGTNGYYVLVVVMCSVAIWVLASPSQGSAQDRDKKRANVKTFKIVSAETVFAREVVLIDDNEKPCGHLAVGKNGRVELRFFSSGEQGGASLTSNELRMTTNAGEDRILVSARERGAELRLVGSAGGKPSAEIELDDNGVGHIGVRTGKGQSFLAVCDDELGSSCVLSGTRKGMSARIGVARQGKKEISMLSLYGAGESSPTLWGHASKNSAGLIIGSSKGDEELILGSGFGEALDTLDYWIRALSEDGGLLWSKPKK